jgi:hypothetical protein
MSDRNADRFAVRPKFLAWLTLAIALPVLAHAAWDYTEARRLRARVDAIAAKGEPTSMDQVRPFRSLTDSGVEAARLYRAAAALASNWNRNSYVPLAPPKNILSSAPQDWSPAQREEANRLVTANSDVLDLVDRATAIEFSGFPPGTDYSYRFAEVWQLEQLASLRTRVLAVDRRDSAVRALHVQLLLCQVLDREYPNTQGWFVESMSRDVALVVGRVLPTDASFAALEALLLSLDRDNRVKQIFQAQRAEWLNNGSVNVARRRIHPVRIPWEWVRRPLDLHMVNEVADLQARYIEFADRPWPQRLEAFRDIDVGPFGDLKDMIAMQRYAAASAMRQEARNAALVRSARIAIAIERAKASKATPEIPTLIDPYSGEPMRVKRDDASYVVYSVGQNRRDDGGHATLDLTFRPVPAALGPNP